MWIIFDVFLVMEGVEWGFLLFWINFIEWGGGMVKLMW